MAYPWVKLYTEIIHDPKIGRLSEHLQLMFVKALCAAGEYDPTREGILPPVDELAWTLRMDDDTLAQDLEALQKAGLVVCADGLWRVTNFAARQGPMKAADRVAAFRDRQQKAAYYETDDDEPCNDSLQDRYTEPLRVVTQTRLDKTRLEEEGEVDIDADAATTTDAVTASFYSGLARLGIVPMSQAHTDAYNDVVQQIRGHPQALAFIEELISEAAATTTGRLSPRWFEVVTDRCIREGRMPGDKRASPQPRAPTTSNEEWAAVAREWGQEVTL